MFVSDIHMKKGQTVRPEAKEKKDEQRADKKPANRARRRDKNQ